MSEILVIVQQPEPILVVVEPPAPILVDVPEALTVIQEAGAIGELPLTVETTGQTQFNIFTAPPGAHWLLINGLEYRSPADYTIQTIGGNVRLVWGQAFALAPGDRLVFITF